MNKLDNREKIDIKKKERRRKQTINRDYENERE
jgi:hypothetical protein